MYLKVRLQRNSEQTNNEDVVGGMAGYGQACRRFSCQARSAFLLVIPGNFAKNHLSTLGLGEIQ